MSVEKFEQQFVKEVREALEPIVDKYNAEEYKELFCISSVTLYKPYCYGCRNSHPNKCVECSIKEQEKSHREKSYRMCNCTMEDMICLGQNFVHPMGVKAMVTIMRDSE